MSQITDPTVFIYSAGDRVSNAVKALDCWNQHQDCVILTNCAGSYVVSQDYMVFALYGPAKQNTAGWCQTSPEEIDMLIASQRD